MKQCILAYDLGTSGVKAGIYDQTGQLLISQYERYSTLYSADDWREQRPQDWWDCIRHATRMIAGQCEVGKIKAIGVSGHSLGAIPVSEAGKLLTEKTPIWSDARAVKQAGSFFEKVDYQQWYETTGNGFPRHLYTVFKEMWLKEHEPELYEKTACFLGSKDYINFCLTGEMATDRSYASGSGVYSLEKEQYVDRYLECAGIDREKLPKVMDSSEIVGYVTENASSELGIPSGIPVVAGGVDNACMALGANCRQDGDAYASLGSSAWITVCTDIPLVNFDTKPYTFAHCLKGKYIPSVATFSSGSSLEWVISQLFAGKKEEENVYLWLSELVHRTPAGANGLIFIPTLAGGAACDPSPDVRGMLANLDLKHTQADVARAVYEGIALHLRRAYDTFGADTAIREKLLLVGGGAKSDEWRRIYASVFGIPVCTTAVAQEAASLGAAALGAIGTGIWADTTPLDSIYETGSITYPDKKEMEYYQELLPKYKALCQLTQDVARILKEEER